MQAKQLKSSAKREEKDGRRKECAEIQVYLTNQLKHVGPILRKHAIAASRDSLIGMENSLSYLNQGCSFIEDFSVAWQLNCI